MTGRQYLILWITLSTLLFGFLTTISVLNTKETLAYTKAGYTRTILAGYYSPIWVKAAPDTLTP